MIEQRRLSNDRGSSALGVISEADYVCNPRSSCMGQQASDNWGRCLGDVLSHQARLLTCLGCLDLLWRARICASVLDSDLVAIPNLVDCCRNFAIFSTCGTRSVSITPAGWVSAPGPSAARSLHPWLPPRTSDNRTYVRRASDLLERGLNNLRVGAIEVDPMQA